MSNWATVGGERVRLWEERMHCLAYGIDAATAFRGLIVETTPDGDRRAMVSLVDAPPGEVSVRSGHDKLDVTTIRGEWA